MQTITVYPVFPETNPPYFGGDGGSGEHPTGNEFANLERSRELPPINVTSFTNDKAVDSKLKVCVESLASGQDLSIELKFEEDKVFIAAYYKGDQFDVTEPLVTKMFYSNLASLSSSIDAPVLVADVWWKPLKVIDTKLANTLAHHMLHLFLRAQGSSICWELARRLCGCVTQESVSLMKKKKWTYLLDISLVRADIAVARKAPNTDVLRSLTQVGEALEALGRFVESAHIYEYATNSYADTVGKKVLHQGFCALAWKRADEYVSAEEAYARALFLASDMEPFDMADPELCSVLTNVISMYMPWDPEDARPECEVQETHLVGAIFVGLLYAAGFRPSGSTLAAQKLSIEGPKFASKLLAKEVRSNRRAKQAILYCCSEASSVAGFHSSLLSCKHPNAHMGMTQVNPAYNKSATMNEGKKVARGFVRESQFVPRECDNIDCKMYEQQDTPFDKCPCKEVYYCSKPCQVAHWRVHSRTCKHRAERKRNKHGKK